MAVMMLEVFDTDEDGYYDTCRCMKGEEPARASNDNTVLDWIACACRICSVEEKEYYLKPRRT